MKEQLPPNNPEYPPAIDDNARKFISTSLPDEFLLEHNAVSFDLIVDWLETDEAYEQKLARKTYVDNTTEIRHITKTTDETGKRSSVKPLISFEKYQALLPRSLCHLEKKRYEFSFVQDGKTFQCNYDEFGNGGLRVLEVDASDEQTRQGFDPARFPAELYEVTGDLRYYGYHVAELVS